MELSFLVFFLKVFEGNRQSSNAPFVVVTTYLCVCVCVSYLHFQQFLFFKSCFVQYVHIVKAMVFPVILYRCES